MNKILLIGLSVLSSIIVAIVIYVLMSGEPAPSPAVEPEAQLLQEETPAEEAPAPEQAPAPPVPAPAPVPAPTPSPPAPAQLPADISKVFGWSGNHENPGDKNQTAEDCRQKALNSGGKYVAWGHRNSTHPDPNWRDTCFLYTQGFAPFAGNPADTVHQTGCLRPGEKVEWGCKTTPPAVNWAGNSFTTDGRCGPSFGNKACNGQQCCSQFGWCGGQKGQNDDWCGKFKAFDGRFDGEKP